MSDYKIENKASRIELERLKNFIDKLIIKDEIEAEKYETLDTSRNAYDYLTLLSENSYNNEVKQLVEGSIGIESSYNGETVNLSTIYKKTGLINGQHILRIKVPTEIDTRSIDNRVYVCDFIVSKSDGTKEILHHDNPAVRFSDGWDIELFIPEMIDQHYSNIPESFVEITFNGTGISVLGKIGPDCGNMEVYLSGYTEMNKYYMDLKEKYNIDYYTARRAKDYSIIGYSKEILSDKEYTKFLELYYSSLQYFMSALYNEAYEEQELYRNFIRMFLIFMTMERYISSRMEFATDIDMFDNYSIRNMFISYGLDFFDDLPLKFQKKILKNLNNLLKYKGTEKSIIDIVDIFNFENINVFKYYLSKEYKKDHEGKYIWTEKDVKFLKVPQETVNIEKDIHKFERLDFDGMIQEDPYWQLSKEEVLQQNFNFINTKYMSIESTLNLVKEVTDMSYFINTVYDLNSNSLLIDLMTMENNIISSEPVSLYNLLIALNIIVLKNMGYADNIVHEQSSLKKLYGYNFNTYNKDSNIYTYTIDGIQYALVPDDVENINIKGINSKNIIKFSDFNDSAIDVNRIGLMFRENNSFRRAFENLISSVKDYKTYRKLMEIYKIKFTSDKITEIYSGFETYSKWLESRDEELLNYITYTGDENDDVLKANFYKDRIIEISNTIDVYLNSQDIDIFLTNNTLATEYFKEYMYRMLNIFKSYTIDLMEMMVIYRFDSKFLSTVKLFEDQIYSIDMKYFTSIDLKMKEKWLTKVQLAKEYMDSIEDEWIGKLFYRFNEYVLDKETSDSKYLKMYAMLNEFKDRISPISKDILKDNLSLQDSCRFTIEEDGNITIKEY